MSCTVEHNDPFGGVYADFLAAASHQDRPRHLVNGQLCMCVCVCVGGGGGGGGGGEMCAVLKRLKSCRQP